MSTPSDLGRTEAPMLFFVHDDLRLRRVVHVSRACADRARAGRLMQIYKFDVPRKLARRLASSQGRFCEECFGSLERLEPLPAVDAVNERAHRFGSSPGLSDSSGLGGCTPPAWWRSTQAIEARPPKSGCLVRP